MNGTLQNMPPKETIHLGQVEIRFLLDGNDTGGSMSMFEFLVAPGAKVPVPHYHEGFDEAAYGIEGVLTFTVDGVPHRIGPGDRCFIPRGKVHHFVNDGTAPVRALPVLTPAVGGRAFFREMAALMKAGPPDPAKAGEIMRRHGLVPAV